MLEPSSSGASRMIDRVGDADPAAWLAGIRGPALGAETGAGVEIEIFPDFFSTSFFFDEQDEEIDIANPRFCSYLLVLDKFYPTSI